MNWIRKQAKRLREWWKRQNEPTPKPDPVDPVPDPTPTPDPIPTPVPDPVPVPTPATDKVTVNGRRFALGGKLFVPIADTAWMLGDYAGTGKLPWSDVTWYFQARRQQGFTVIQFGDAGLCFEKDGSPRENQLRVFDRILDSAEAAGIMVYLGCERHRYQDGKPVEWITDAAARSAGRIFASRFAGRKCVMAFWVSGLDDHYGYSYIAPLAQGVREGAPGHLIGWHPAHGQASYPTVQIGALCDFCTLQSDQTDVAALIARCPSTVPVWDVEPCYEGETKSDGHVINADDVARQVGTAAKNGAAGVAYGHNLVWAFAGGWQSAVKSAPGWKQAIEAAAKIGG